MNKNKLLFSFTFITIMALTLSACSNQKTNTTSNAPTDENISEEDGATTDNIQTWDTPPDNILEQNKEYTATLKTNLGDIQLKLNTEVTPLAANSFVFLSEQDFYDNVIFHRVIKDFMIQGGDPTGTGSSGPGYTLQSEFSSELFHKKGALAAARLPDSVNPDKDSSGSQFYIVTGKIYTNEQLNSLEIQMGITFTPEQREAYTTIGGDPFLDGEYTVFGEVIEGMDIVDQIQTVQTDSQDKPLDDIVITDVIIEKKDK